ncbi:NAD(P)-binding protein [Mycena olivaceomarginata]|nr:NAD(P)-binding protein [Mycena olivaceomarginata]
MPIITIFGANGTQGGTHRALFREALDSAGSKALIAKGIEVVTAISGSEVVFGGAHLHHGGSTRTSGDPEVFPADPKGAGEITQGKNLVDAAKEVGVKFFIWSSLPNATKESNGLYKHIYHVDNKAVIEDYLRASGVPFAVLLTGWFAENLYKIGALQKSDTGYTIPIAKYAPEDTQVHDLAAVALLTNYTDASKGVLGKSYPVVSFRPTYPQFAEAIAKAIKKEVKFVALETAGLVEFDEMFLYQAKIGMYNDTPIPNPDLVTLGVKFGTVEEFIQKRLCLGLPKVSP